MPSGVVGQVGPRKYALDGLTHWRQLAIRLNDCVRQLRVGLPCTSGSDAACSQITLGNHVDYDDDDDDDDGRPTYCPEDANLAEAATSEDADGFRALGRRAVYSVHGGRCRRPAVGRLLRLLAERRRTTGPKQGRSLGHLLSQNSVHRRP